jgi:predicted PhzF superfamily epimerase YddE/YHI9
VKGMTFVLVELDDLDALKLVSLAGGSITIGDLDSGWNETFIGAYFFVRTGKSHAGAATVQARMIEGPLEDPATGSAASALTAYLSLKEGTSGECLSYEIIQGVEMGRRSEILIGKSTSKDRSVRAALTVFGRC